MKNKFFMSKINAMHIFYSKKISEGIHYLSEEESKHCIQVLRLKVGNHIYIYDGLGGKYMASLTSVNPKKCYFQIENFFNYPQKTYKIHLGIAMPKRIERMEWLVEKLEELGIDEITFITTKHSVRKKVRLERLNKKVIAAMKQSNNPYLLKINPIDEFTHFIKQTDHIYKHKFMATPNQKLHLAQTKCKHESVIILIGPEGGFCEKEILHAKGAGYLPVGLGNHIFRTETAGLLACSTIHFINAL